jgi:hypothetical protein
MMQENNESVENKMGSLEDVLGLMDRVNEVFAYEVWVPSLKKRVMFREINTNQQKRLIKSIIDSPIYNTEFIFTLRKIIKENCVDSSIDVDKLTLIDKLIIAIKMRSTSVGDILEIDIPVGEGDTETTIKRGVSLESLYEKFEKIVSIPSTKSFTDTNGIYTITCGVPTIGTEYKLEEEMRKNVEVSDIKDYNELRETIGEVFVGELAKYITSISIKNEDESTNIDLNALSFKNRIALIGRIPERVIHMIMEYIKTVKEEMDKITLVEVNVGTEESPEMKKETFAIDGSFFTGS